MSVDTLMRFSKRYRSTALEKLRGTKEQLLILSGSIFKRSAFIGNYTTF